MDTIKPLQLSVNKQIIEQNKRFHLIISVTMGINLSSFETTLEFDFLKDLFSCMGNKPLPDTGMPKPKGEYLISGSFYSPDKQPLTGGEVRAVIGNQQKSLYVSGPRTWRNGFPLKPEPIISLPLDYSYSFGGAKYNKNPDGIGFNDGHLPNIEYPDKLITSPDDTPEPAGFGPVDPSWPQRMQYQPKYDSVYKQKYFPGYPPDFDWHYFLCAPRDQWLDGYYKGNEPFELYNMHPESANVRGTLPGLYPRCFVNHTLRDRLTEFEELKLNLDTLWFIPEKMLALLIWRGEIEVFDDEASQVQQCILGYEQLQDEPRTKEYYFQALQKRTIGNDPLLNNFNTEDLIPRGHKCAMELLQEKAFANIKPGEFEKNIEAKSEQLKKSADEKIADALQKASQQLQNSHIPDEAKTDPGKMMTDPTNQIPDADIHALNEKIESILPGLASDNLKKLQLKNFSFAKIDEIMDAVNSLVDKKEKEAKTLAKEQITKAKDQIKAQMSLATTKEIPAESKQNLDQVMEMLDSIDMDKTSDALLPRLNTDEIIIQLSTISPQVMSAMQHVQGMKAMGIKNQETEKLEVQILEILAAQDQQIKEGLLEAEQAFKEGYFMSAHFMENGHSPHSDALDVVAQRFKDAVAAGIDVKNGDWACIDLCGQNLDGIDLSGAYLEQVNFKGASLKNANLNKAIMARANLEDADFTGANLEGANIGGVHALRTNFTDANLKSSKLSKGNFTEANFTGSDLDAIESMEIIINGANFTKAHIPGLMCISSEIKNTLFKGATLITTVVYDSTITDTDFSDADLTGTVFADARIKNNRFDNANCTRVCFAVTAPDKFLFENCSFVKACLNSANFKDMILQKTDFSGASMENANFGGANLEGSLLCNAQAKGAQFRKANLKNTNLKNINLMEGSIAKANCADATFEGANLYCADILRSNLYNTKFNKCNLDGTLIDEWKQQ